MRIPESDAQCWFDGHVVPVSRAGIPLNDSAVLAGFGLFETLAVREGAALDLEPHLSRLSAGAKRLDLTLPPRDTLIGAIRGRARASRAELSWLKIVATGGGHLAVFTGPVEAGEEGKSVAAVLLPWLQSSQGPFRGLKTLQYGANLAGLARARRAGADEGLWRNERGLLTEGCTSNLFLVRRGRLHTPSVKEGALPGVVRALTLRVASDQALVVHEGKVRVPRLQSADEAFLTSSVRGLRPLVRFGGRPVGTGEPGPITRRLQIEVGRVRARDPGFAGR